MILIGIATFLLVSRYAKFRFDRRLVFKTGFDLGATYSKLANSQFDKDGNLTGQFVPFKVHKDVFSE